jgi:hypothetical protein
MPFGHGFAWPKKRLTARPWQKRRPHTDAPYNWCEQCYIRIAIIFRALNLVGEKDNGTAKIQNYVADRCGRGSDP